MGRKQIDIVTFGQKVTGISFSIGESVDFNFTCENPENRAEMLDLTSTNLTAGLCKLDPRGNPILPPVVPRQADILDPGTDGKCRVQINPSDTVPGGVPILPGKYGFGLWFTDEDGNRTAMLSFCEVELIPATVLPATQIVPLPQQDPLAQGPQGIQGIQGEQGESSINAFRRTISQPADGSDFFVTFPSAQANDDYTLLHPTLINSSVIVGFYLPDVVAGDRTTTQFRCVTTAPLPNGAIVEFQFQVTP